MADDQPTDDSATERTVLKPPTGLKAEGKRLWTQIWATYDLNAGENAILEAACRARDTIKVLQAELASSSYLISGSMGQQVINPLVTEIRQHEKQAADLINSLKLPVDPGQASAGAERNQARDAINTRWAQRG